MVYTKYNPNELIPKLKARLNLTEYNLNLIGIRGKMGKRYRYPDTMIVIVNIMNKLHYYEYSASTKAYLDGILKADNFGYQLMLLPGYYPNLWKLDKRTNMKLYQNIEIPIGLGKLDMKTTNVDKYEVGYYGIVKGADLSFSCHRHKAKQVGELLCQFMARVDDLYQIIALANLQAKEIGKRQFSYLLIEDRDGDIIIPDSVWTTKKQ